MEFRRYNYFIFVVLHTLILMRDVSADKLQDRPLDFRQTPIVPLHEWEMTPGDDASVSSLELTDTVWTSIDLRDKSLFGGYDGTRIIWLRKAVLLDTLPEDQHLLLSSYYVTCAAEFYWDGTRIGSNGRVGQTADEEQPGRVLSRVRIPLEGIESGDHVLAMRISSHCRPPRIDRIELGLDEAFRKTDLRTNNANVFITAFFITSAMLNIILFFGFNRNVAYLFLFLYCVFHTLKILMLPSWLFLESDVISIQFNERMLYLFVMLGSVSLIAFLIYKFPLPKKIGMLSLAAAISLLCFFTIPERTFFPASVAVTFGISSYAAFKKWDGRWMILFGLIGLSIGSALWYRGMFNFGYFLGIMFFIAAMNIAVGRQIARQSRLHHEAVLRSSRLQTELLKQNIQPHFIMNSLTSIQELIDTDPAKATECIDALAEEFRMFSKICGETLIPLGDELELCKAHLKIMGFRKDACFTIETEGLSGDERIPPGIFHTLIENGLTHGFSKQYHGHFRLQKETASQGIRYILSNDGEVSDNRDIGHKGTGIHYVEARLEESFPGRWTLHSRPVENGWNVTIEISDRPPS